MKKIILLVMFLMSIGTPVHDLSAFGKEGQGFFFFSDWTDVYSVEKFHIDVPNQLNLSKNPEVDEVSLSVNTTLDAWNLSQNQSLGKKEGQVLHNGDQIEFVYKVNADWFGVGHDIDTPPPYFLPENIWGYDKFSKPEYCNEDSAISRIDRTKIKGMVDSLRTTSYFVPMIIKNQIPSIVSKNLICAPLSAPANGQKNPYILRQRCRVNIVDEKETMIQQKISGSKYAQSICKVTAESDTYVEAHFSESCTSSSVRTSVSTTRNKCLTQNIPPNIDPKNVPSCRSFSINVLKNRCPECYDSVKNTNKCFFGNRYCVSTNPSALSRYCPDCLERPSVSEVVAEKSRNCSRGDIVGHEMNYAVTYDINQAPSQPQCEALNGACPKTLQINQPGNFRFISTDPEKDDLIYHIDWNADSVADETSNILSSATPFNSHPHQWDAPAQYYYQAQACEAAHPDVCSGWAYFSIDVQLPPNTRPSAVIDDPNENATFMVNNPVVFRGHGTDPDPGGSIQGHQWSTDGCGTNTQSNVSSFSRTFPTGDYTYYFRVMDNRGDWSTCDSRTIHVSACSGRCDTPDCENTCIGGQCKNDCGDLVCNGTKSCSSNWQEVNP